MRSKPWEHQLREFVDHAETEARAKFWRQRTGKTKSTIDRVCYNYEEGRINGHLIVAPNGVHANWVRKQMPMHLWDGIDHRGVAWLSSPGRLDAEGYEQSIRDMLRHRGLKTLAINREALRLPRVQKLINEFRKATGDRFQLTGDETHHFGRAGSKQTLFMRTLARRAAMREILSGTPVLQSPRKAFSQFEILHKGCLGFTQMAKFDERYTEWEIAYGAGGREFKKVAGYKNMEELRAKIALYSSVVLRSDCKDMPPLHEVTREVALSDAQREAYVRMVDEWLMDFGGEPITVMEGGVRLIKLQQILSGFLVDDKKQIHSIDDNPPRLQGLMDELEGTDGKAVIWCRFREDIRRVKAALTEAYGAGSVVTFAGGMTPAQRYDAEDRFQSDKGVRWMVGQAQSGGEGRDFSAASTVIFYTYDHNAVTWDQAKERATKIGGDAVDLVTITAPGTVEDRLLDVIAGRISLSDMLAGRGLQEILRATNV